MDQLILPIKMRYPDEPDALAKAYLDGKAGSEVLLDDRVFDNVMDQALGKTRAKVAARIAAADRAYAKGAATRFGKGELTVFGVEFDNIAIASEADLVLAAHRVTGAMLDPTLSNIEKSTYTQYASAVQAQLLRLKGNQDSVAKAILTKEKDNSVKPAGPPAQNKGQGVTANGDTAFKYNKTHGGKGPGKQPTSVKGPKGAPGKGAPPGADAGQGEQDTSVTPPPPVDPKAFAAKMGKVEDIMPLLDKLVKKLPRDKFAQYWLQKTDFAAKHNLTAQYLSALYDALVAPPPPPQQPAGGKSPPGIPPMNTAPAAAGGAPAAPPPAGAPPAMKKGVVFRFVGASSDAKNQQILKALKKQRVSNPEQMQATLKSLFAISELQAVHLTRTLLRKWEADSVVNFV